MSYLGGGKGGKGGGNGGIAGSILEQELGMPDPNVNLRKPPGPSGVPISFIKISPICLNTITNGKSGSIPGTLKLVTVLSSLMAIAPTAPAALQFWNLRRYPQPVVLTRQYFPLISRALRILPHADPTIVCGGSFRPGLAIAPSALTAGCIAPKGA